MGLLYILAAGLKETGAINVLTARILGRPKTVREAQLRLVLPVGFLSAFANNTPIVTSFLPVIHATARRCKLPASKLYMPLSFAAILGGLGTLIGTSTTLIVAGLILDKNDLLGEGATKLPEFGMFTIASAGVPVAIAGFAYILLFGRRLLPDRDGEMTPEESAKKYMTAMRVEPTSPIVGKTIEQAGLRSLPGLYLSRIDRLETTVIAVGPDEIIQPRDVLVFVGILDSVMDLQKMQGLTPVTSDSYHPEYRPSLRTVEAVVSATSPLVGSTIRQAGMRSKYGAVVVAVHRHGHALKGKVGDIRLAPGDTLLLEAGPNFAERYRHANDFILVSERDSSATHRHERAWLAIAILIGLVLAISTGIAEPVAAAMAAATLTILLRCCTGPQAREADGLVGPARDRGGVRHRARDGLDGARGRHRPRDPRLRGRSRARRDPRRDLRVHRPVHDVHHEQRGGGADVPHRLRRRQRGGHGVHPRGGVHRGGGVGGVLNPHRLPDEPHRHGTGRVQMARLHEVRAAPDDPLGRDLRDDGLLRLRLRSRWPRPTGRMRTAFRR